MKYTNGCRGVSGAKQQHFSFKTYLVFIRKRNITFEDILHYKYVPEQVIGDTTNDCSTWREESAQLRGLMPHRKDGAQSLQSGLGEWQRERDGSSPLSPRPESSSSHRHWHTAPVFSLCKGNRRSQRQSRSCSVPRPCSISLTHHWSQADGLENRDLDPAGLWRWRVAHGSKQRK